MGTTVAYVRNPEHKAFVLMLPVPFTLASLALGRPIDATNVLGFGLFFLYTIGVWTLHVRCRWPILASIVFCATGYSLMAAFISRVLPSGPIVFWLMELAILCGSVVLIRTLPYRQDPHHRTPLPIWIKLPAIVLVITGIIAIKQYLGGFMTTFPMLGVIAAYEARNSLWTIVRRMPWLIFMMVFMMAQIRLTQVPLGLPGALALSWPLLLVLLWLLRSRYHGDGIRTDQSDRTDQTDPLFLKV